MITNQAYLFLIFVFNGIIIGILFDFFRILRKSFSGRDIITYIEDILFWILTGIILLYSFFTFNNGEIRLFMFLGVILGCIFYMITISKYFIKINVAIITVLKKIIYQIVKVLTLPFQFIFKMLKKILFKPITFIMINFRKFSTKCAIKFSSLFQFNKISKNNVKNAK